MMVSRTRLPAPRRRHAALPATLVTLLLAPLPEAARRAAAAAVPDPAWRATADGLEVRVHVGTPERAEWPSHLVLVRLDPARHPLRVLAAEPGAGIDVPAAARRAGAIAAVNGGFFDAAGRAIGWVVSDGQTRGALAPEGWGVFVVPLEGPPAIHAASAVPEGLAVREALEAGPRLVVAGRPNALKPQVARRSFVGIDSCGRVVLGSTGLAVAEAGALARFLAAPESEGGAGLRSALALDGGSSAQLFVRGGADDGSDLVVPGLVAVPNALAVLPARGTAGHEPG